MQTRWKLSAIFSRLAAAILVVVALLGIVGLQAADEAAKPFNFTTHTQTVGPLQLKLEPVDLITETNQTQKLAFQLTNKSDTALPCQLKFSTIETIRFLSDSLNQSGGAQTKDFTASVTVPANGTFNGTAEFVVLDGTYSAHYPLHVVGRFQADGKSNEIHSVRVIETKLARPGKSFETTKIKIGGVSLIGKSYTASRDYPGEPSVELGQNWIGTDTVSRTGCNIYPYSAGETRTAFSCHPPYTPKGGSLYLTFPVELPNSEKLTLGYGCAVRKVLPPEPPTDGVTFRIWGQIGDSPKQVLDEIHTTSTTWVDRLADLTPLAGKKANIIVEFNPGPKNNTTCDGCFISGLIVNSVARTSIAPSIDAHLKSKRFSFDLNEGFAAYIYPGSNGLLDSKIDIGKPGDEKSFVSYDGINLSVGNLNLLNPGVVYTKAPALTWDANQKRLVFTAEILNNDQRQSITVFVYQKNGILIFDVPEGNPAEICSFYLKASDKSVKRVYFGHGFVIDNPKGYFAQGHGGHELAASHVGFDYENGTSVVLGSPDCPNHLSADPEKNLYVLDNSGVCRLELIPSARGAFAAAIAFRQNDPFHSAPSKGTVRKRGRLTFDVWGGTYADDCREVRDCFAYGVNDALFLKHVWQYWGYDVRLPDIWNPQSDNPVLPSLGKFEELKDLAETCKSYGIPFGLHDNYIDFYPDADNYSYDYITFHQNGTPRRAWVNHGAQVLSYQWRPDLFKPFLVKNMKLGKQYLPTMDAYFVDVFTSMKPFDFYTRDGEFHPKSETQACWKDCFETIGAELGHRGSDGKLETAITNSEAAADFLIGSIDGGDCQWMLIDSTRSGAWRKFIPCENWARTPWFTAVNHTNFSRHGAGYQDRYNAVRNIHLHNVMSDDYISAEILGGLDLMVVKGCVFPGAVRKHYLAQHVVRQLADKEIENVEFESDNVRRQCVTWSDGTKVYVNRGAGDWNVRGYLVPKYGYVVFDKDGKLLSTISRNPDNEKEVVEYSQRADGSFYLNGRGKSKLNVLPIQPVLQSARIFGNGTQFETVINWNALEAAPKDLSIFVHVFEPKQGYGFKPTGWYAGGEWPSVPTSQWTAEKSDDTYVYSSGKGQIYTIPEDMRDGTYHVMVGLFDSKGDGRRYSLMGEDAQETRYSVAKFRIRSGKIDGQIEPVEISETPEDFARLTANRTPARFGGVETLGALSVKKIADGWELLPIPLLDEFAVTMDESVVGKISSVTCSGQSVSLTRSGTKVSFTVVAKDAKRYLVR